MDIQHTFAKNLKLYREKAGMTRRELAARIGVSPTSIGYYETSERVAGIDTVAAIADVLKVSIDELTGNDFSVAVRECENIGFTMSPVMTMGDNGEPVRDGNKIHIAYNDGEDKGSLFMTRADFMECFADAHNDPSCKFAVYTSIRDAIREKQELMIIAYRRNLAEYLGIDPNTKDLQAAIAKREQELANGTLPADVAADLERKHKQESILYAAMGYICDDQAETQKSRPSDANQTSGQTGSPADGSRCHESLQQADTKSKSRSKRKRRPAGKTRKDGTMEKKTEV